MKIAFNPSNSSKNILDLIKNNKDIIFDLKGHSIYARGVEFKGTDTNTWRPVVDNLTSNSATSSLSANQGRVLAGLINGKSDSDHNHDGRYVKKSGDTMFGVLTIDTTNFGALTIKRNDDANGASIQFRGKSNIYGYIGLNNSTKDKQFLRWNSDTSRIYTILDTSSTYTANGKGVINGTTITQVDNATNSTNSTNARKLVNWYSARPTSLNAQFGDGSLRIFYATSSTTVGKCPDDATVLHLAWDNNGGWDTQLALAPEENKMYFRGQNKSTWQSWKTLAFTTDNVASATNAYHLRINSVNTWSTWYWAGQGGQPSWLWGSNDGTNMYVWNPSNFRVAYASSAGNADTVDGEHASNFVRAGNFESANLNSLDTYSFIKSVKSTVASASPGGYTGWYNVIQAVHRNGSGDGPGYIGQIALGMTTNIGGMFYRTKYKGSWYAWHEVVTTNTGLLRYSRNNVNISSPNCSPIPPSLLEWTIGYPRLYDPEFNEGYNYVGVYNTGNGVVTVTRVHDTNVGNSSSYIMKVVSAAGASPNYGGWHVATQTELGKVYTCLFRASIPSGVEIEFNTNSIGSGGGSAWLTNNMGTGKWTWYAMQVYCGSGGSTTFFFSAKKACTWYLSYVNVIENNRASYAGLRSVYSDYLKANASIVFGRNELQYFNQYTGVTAGATNNANPKTNWYHILRMNHANNSGYFVDLAIPFFDNRIQFRRITSGSDNGWRRVITEEPNHDVILREASTGGNVGIGINNPAYKLDVNGQMRAEGFHHWTVNSDNYMLLAGGGYKSFGGDDSNPVFLGYLNLDHGNDGTISSSFSCLGYSVPFTYTRGGSYCRIYIPDTTHQVFYIRAATASVHYSGGGMDTWTGVHRGSGAWWLHCYAQNTNEVRVKGFCQNNSHNDSWWGGNPLQSGNDGANRITVCIFGYVKFR